MSPSSSVTMVTAIGYSSLRRLWETWPHQIENVPCSIMVRINIYTTIYATLRFLFLIYQVLKSTTQSKSLCVALQNNRVHNTLLTEAYIHRRFTYFFFSSPRVLERSDWLCPAACWTVITSCRTLSTSSFRRVISCCNVCQRHEKRPCIKIHSYSTRIVNTVHVLHLI